jgi:hypothetical protein
LDLDTLLSPVTVPVFLDRYFGQSFLHVAGSPEKFAAFGTDTLAQALEHELEAPVRVNGIDDSMGIPLHCLEQDGILLQLGGESGCQVGTSADLPAWEGPLSAGGALYIPRGWWLGAAPGGKQVSFDILNPTGADLLDWLVGHVKQNEAFRADIPRFADPAAKADYATGLRRVLARTIRTPGLLEGYRRAANLNAHSQHASGVAWSASAPDHHLIALLTPRKIRIKRADNETILLVAMGKRLPFPQDAAPLLHFLSDRAPVPIAEFYQTFAQEFDRDELSDLLSTLSREGIVGLREPHSI